MQAHLREWRSHGTIYLTSVIERTVEEGEAVDCIYRSIYVRPGDRLLLVGHRERRGFRRQTFNEKLRSSGDEKDGLLRRHVRVRVLLGNLRVS